MKNKHQIENWNHYYKIASEKPELNMFKHLLEVNMNFPNVDVSNYKMTFTERIKKEGEKDELKYTTKTFGQLIQELKP